MKNKKSIIIFIAIMCIFFIYIAIDTSKNEKEHQSKKTKGMIDEQSAITLCQSFYKQIEVKYVYEKK
jgi:uncharacterized membrane protein